MKHIASYFASVDETGSPLCGWIESKGNRCFDNAAYLDKRVKAFFCKKHAEITRCQVKHHQLVELHIDDDNQILKQRIKRLEEALNTAWEIIANTSGGEWKQQHPQWQKAAARWRDNEFLPAMLDRKEKEAKP